MTDVVNKPSGAIGSKNRPMGPDPELTVFLGSITRIEVLINLINDELASDNPDFSKLDFYEATTNTFMDELTEQLRAAEDGGMAYDGVRSSHHILSVTMMKLVATKGALLHKIRTKLQQSLAASIGTPENEPDHSSDVEAEHTDDTSMTDMTRQQVTDLLAASEAKIDARLANFDTSIKTGFADIRAEFSGVRADFAKMQADVSKGATETIKWAIALSISVVIMTVGLLTFINKTAEKPQVAPAPAPIVITVPATPSAAAVPQSPKK